MNLITMGFKAYFKEQVTNEELIGRIIKYAQNHYTLMTEDGIIAAEITGNMKFNHTYPRLGDFVVYETSDDQSLHIIKKILERKTCLSRKEAGNRSDSQIIATNMDYLFIVMSLNEDFNLRRLERFMIGAWESGAEPIVILTKVDLCEDLEEKMEQVHAVTYGVKTISVSALKDMGMEQLLPYHEVGKTIALVGSSGVGKSTLINKLAGHEIMKTDGLRNDDRGHHTTTHREMIFTDGAMLIDTPGMREFSAFDGTEGLKQEFEDIENLMKDCRFVDCGHNQEPGCAVQEALQNGQLDQSRYNNYMNLQREILHQEKKRKNKERIMSQNNAKINRKSKPRTKKWNPVID